MTISQWHDAGFTTSLLAFGAVLATAVYQWVKDPR